MSLIQKLFSRKPSTPATRVRVCMECGMPVESHANWCAILRTQQEMDLKRAERDLAVRAVLNFLDDGVAVLVAVGERQQHVEQSRGQRQERLRIARSRGHRPQTISYSDIVRKREDQDFAASRSARFRSISCWVRRMAHQFA